MTKTDRALETMRSRVLPLLLLSVAAACSDATGTRPPEDARNVAAIAGVSRSAAAGCELPVSLAVLVTDDAGTPVRDAPVRFARAGSDASVTVHSDGKGEARVDWVVGGGDPQRVVTEKVVASLEIKPAVAVSFAVHSVPTGPDGYATHGNQILDASCRPHRFVGVARPGLEYWPEQERFQKADLAAADFAVIRSWGANIVRIPLGQRFWLRDVTLEGMTFRKEKYQALVEGTVQRALDAGLDVMLTLHTSDRGDPAFPDNVATIQQMADVNHSIPFWKEVAHKFKDDPRVIFQLYNEPNQLEEAAGSEAGGWAIWRDGGMIPEGQTMSNSKESSGVAYQAAGMQDLYDAVRSTGANNLVVVNGMHWGYYLTRVPEYAIDGYNVVYASHPYDYYEKQPDRWEGDWGFLSDTHPVMVTEFGDHKCNGEGFYNKLLDYADRRMLCWIAWAWIAPRPDRPEMVCEFPTLITDWSGTPSPMGQVVKARMQSYAR